MIGPMKIVGMRTGVALLCWAAVAAQGEDMKTLAGLTYSNVVVQRFDRQGYFIRYDGGVTQVFYREIMPELRGHYRSRALYPLAAETMAGEKEAPAGPNDLETLGGQIYRNVVLKQVNEDSIRIAHDAGLSTVHFSAIPPALHEKYRTGTPVEADPPPGADDLVTTYGQVFRNVEILQAEPDGLTFRHDGGVTKLGFPSLSEELKQKHGYDPIVAWKYQRDMAASNKAAQASIPVALVSTSPATILVRGIETDALEDNTFWVRFAVQNLTDQAQSVRIVPCEQGLAPIMGGKTIDLPARAPGSQQQLVVPEIRPVYLKVSSGTYFTNCLLAW